MNIFEKAARVSLRFDSSKGQITVEDLWKLPLKSAKGPSLDGLAIQSNRLVQQTQDESFVSRTITNTDEVLRLGILKYIITARLEENAATVAATANKAQKDKILGVLARKQDAALEGMSEEDLQAMVDKL